MKLSTTTESVGLGSALWGRESLKQANHVEIALLVHLGYDLTRDLVSLSTYVFVNTACVCSVNP